MKGKFMNFKEMAITQNAGMCSYLTIAWAVPYLTNHWSNMDTSELILYI